MSEKKDKIRLFQRFILANLKKELHHPIQIRPAVVNTSFFPPCLTSLKKMTQISDPQAGRPVVCHFLQTSAP